MPNKFYSLPKSVFEHYHAKIKDWVRAVLPTKTSDLANDSDFLNQLALAGIVASNFSTESTYEVGNYVLHNHTLYRCKTAISTAGVWDASKWDSAKTQDIFRGSAPGLVPAAESGDADKVLKGDGTWGEAGSSVRISYDAQTAELHLDFRPAPLYDDFVLVYNGSYNSGLSVNHGAFGNAISDNTCPIKGASCFDLGEITTDSTLGTPSLSWYYPTELGTLFNSSAWTLDFWFKYSITSGTKYVYLGDANNSGQAPFATLQINNNGTFYCSLLGDSSALQVPISEGWHHLAFIVGGDNPGVYLDGTRLVTKGNSPYGGRVSIYITKPSATGVRIANIGLRNRAVWNDSFTPPTQLYCQNLT